MEAWYAAEDAAMARESEEISMMEYWLDDCLKIAAEIAPLYYKSCIDDGIDGDNESWHDWLIEEASMRDFGTRNWDTGEHDYELYEAMCLFCQRETEAFTDYTFVLTQTDNKQDA
ncbi:hypothetical protein [Neisseria dentiae]|nr:hypothetical protein [Neisseria dentiae]QMT44256.1 hypothetical protein H3L92_07100 [Neisseria dentiae]